MLNLKKDIAVTTNIDEEVADRLAQINDLTNEVSALIKLKNNEDTYVTREDLANKFHCDPKKLPRSLQGFRLGKTVLYKQTDIDNFIQSKMRKR